MTIAEPSTVATDFVLGLSGVIFAILTYRLKSSHRAMALWILAFVCSATAAFVGGTYHGFRAYIDPGVAKSMWDFTMNMIGGTAAFIISAAIVSSLRRKHMEYVRWLQRGLLVSVAGFVIQKIGWDPSPFFNHNDQYHLIQVVGFFC